MDLALVIDKLVPAADYRRADDIATLTETWVDPRPIPSKAEINAAWAEIQAEQSIATSRKIWETVADFWAEFTTNEQYAIQVSVAPEIIIARGKLAMWRGGVWSDDPRVTGALDALVSATILTPERKAEILAL
jgi:protein tyrosine phosphatase